MDTEEEDASFVVDDAEDMRVREDLVTGEDEPPPPEEEEDGPGDDADDEEMGGCESGEPEIEPLREDAVAVLLGHESPVFAVTRARAAAGAAVLASGSGDDTAAIWRLAGGGGAAAGPAGGGGQRWERQTLRAHADTVANLAISGDASRLASGSMDGTVGVWSTESGALLRTLEGPGGAIEWVCWHPRGPVVLAGSEDFTTWMWAADTGSCMQVFTGHRAEVSCGRFSPDGKCVITAGMDASLRVWSPRSGTATAVVEGHGFHARAITALDCHADSAVALSASEDGMVCLTNVGAGRVLTSFAGDAVRHTDAVESVGFCPAADQLCASAGLDGRVIIWDVSAQRHRNCLEHADGVTCLAWHPTAPLLATAGLDSVVRVWDARSAACVRELHGHRKSVHDLQFCESPGGAHGAAALVVSASEDASVRVFDASLR